MPEADALTEPASPAGIWQRRGGDVLALIAGALLPLAFAPFNYFLLGLVCPAVLFLLWRHVTPARALWRGWLFGLGQFGVGVSWVYVSIHTFGHAPVIVTLGLTIVFIAFLALYPALLGGLSVRWFALDDHGCRLLVWPAAWALLEWLRGWVLSGFPWLSIGYSQTDTPLAGYAALLGVFGVSWVLALCAAAATLLPRISAVLLLLGMLGGGVALEHVDWTHADGKPRSVALVQANISQAVKWQAEQREPTLDLYRDLTRAHWNNDLIVWPETAVPIFYDEVAKTFIAEMQAEARAHHADLLIGIPLQDANGDHYYNAMMSLGTRQDFYRKRHLVPFGEYLPLRPLLGWLLDYLQIPMSDFTAGPTRQPLLQAAGHPAGLSICYEDAFGDETIMDLPAAAYLVNVSNDAWFGNSFAPHQHLQIARMRALETGRYLLRATNTGISAIIGPQGQVLARSPQFQATVVTGVIQPMRGATPYVRWGNHAIVILLIALLAFAGWRCSRQVR